MGAVMAGSHWGLAPRERRSTCLPKRQQLHCRTALACVARVPEGVGAQAGRRGSFGCEAPALRRAEGAGAIAGCRLHAQAKPLKLARGLRQFWFGLSQFGALRWRNDGARRDSAHDLVWRPALKQVTIPALRHPAGSR
jgi:hypothetical protein